MEGVLGEDQQEGAQADGPVAGSQVLTERREARSPRKLPFGISMRLSNGVKTG